jgi:hypothetical protein
VKFFFEKKWGKGKRWTTPDSSSSTRDETETRDDLNLFFILLVALAAAFSFDHLHLVKRTAANFWASLCIHGGKRKSIVSRSVSE